MKTNLLRYLEEYRDKSFGESAFSEVDALLLSQLSYLKMDGLVPGFSDTAAVTLEELAAHPDSEHLFSDALYGLLYRKIFSLIRGSRRYGRMRIHYFVEGREEEREIQFAAVTFFLGPTSVFVSFRGTDESLVGWKEDFNMAYMKSVPSQRLALSYLKGVGRYVLRSEGSPVKMMLGGHSKGGNLAIYAASCASEGLQKMIRRVYSFDGPGFPKEFYETEGFRRMEDRYRKIVPEQSLVGMLFANYKKYRVVRSYGTGVVQHDLMQWKIRNGRFVCRSDLRRSAHRRMESLNGWINSLSREQVMDFVETLYTLVRSTQASSVYELLKKPVKVLHLIRKGFSRLDKERKKLILETLRRLM